MSLDESPTPRCRRTSTIPWSPSAPHRQRSLPGPGNHVVGVGPEVVATLPERLQELLGYGIYPPFVGYVDGRHPRRFLPQP